MSIKPVIFFFLLFCWQHEAKAQISHPPFRYKGEDSVITYVSSRYHTNSFLHRLLMGKNYRDVWEQTVTLPVFRMSDTKFTIDELGGGMQTKSLKLKDPKGKNWTLRTIDKDVQGAFPKALKKTFIKDIAQDQVSAAMPYAPLVISALLKPTDITSARPVIYFVADDPDLGPHRALFANTICMLEERDPDFDDTDNTKKILRRLQGSNRYQINQQALLEARLFDMLIADWDRHFDNWRWGVNDSAGLTMYQPIPRDRDWAFYYSGGLIPKLARIVALRFLVNFKEEPKYIKGLNLKAHAFDGAFLNEMTRAHWQAALTRMQQTLTDSVIERAVQKLPSPVFDLEGESFTRKLKSRRDNLEKEVMSYYRFLSRKVQIDGSNDSELFSVVPAEKGILLQIYRLPAGDKTKRQRIYQRHFLDEETDQIILNGLGDDDVFAIDAQVASGIRLTLNGGTGRDSYDLSGNIRCKVHEHGAEEANISNKNGASVSFH